MNFQKSGVLENDVQAQKDYYKGTWYRSKLESKTAQALDNLGIAYRYEPDGYKLSNGMWYRPDFYLPDANQYIECKGVMSNEDSAKVVGLVEDKDLPVLVVSYDNAMLVMRAWNRHEHRIVAYSGSEVRLATCAKCRTQWFYSTLDTYECPYCGACDGDHYILASDQIRSATDLFKLGQSMAADKQIYHDMAEKFNN